MNQWISFGLDAVAITLLALGVYYPRHRRRDLVTAYFSVNVGVLAVTSLLTTANIGMGLGLGLFGVLSIIRLRSIEVSQNDVAYYFSSLALGLLGGLSLDLRSTAALMTAIVGTLYLADHPKLGRRYHTQMVVLDEAIADETLLRQKLGARLGAEICQLNIQRLDYVNETTLVEVTSVPALTAPPATTPAAPSLGRGAQ